MEDVKGLLEKMVLAQLSKDESAFFMNLYDECQRTGDDTLYRAWLQPRVVLLESKYKMDALDKVLQKKYYSYYCNVIDEMTSEDMQNAGLPLMSSMKLKEEKKEEIKNSDYVFLTIAPELSAGAFECIKCMEKLVKLKFIIHYLYVLEQRFNGEPTEKYKVIGDGLHMHILLKKTDYKRAHIIRDTKRVFGTINVNIDFKFIKDCDIPKVQNYMIGDKADESKQVKQHYDRIWREKIGIKPYYGELFNDLIV